MKNTNNLYVTQLLNFERMKKLSVIFMLCLFCLTTAFAQSSKSGLSFQFGAILPSAQFDEHPSLSWVLPNALEYDFSNAGGAMLGASFGIKYTYTFKKTALENSGLGVFISADGMWNALQKDIRNEYDKLNLTKPMYVNIPIMVGVNYTTQFSKVFGLWAEAGIGADLLIKTPEGFEDNLVNYKLSAEFAVEAGAGIILARTVSLGAHYYWMGNHDIFMKTNSVHPVLNQPTSMKVGVWAFKLGFHF